MIASFLLFIPFSRLPLGSLESEVRGFPFFTGSLARNRENAMLPVKMSTSSRKPAMKQRDKVPIDRKAYEVGRRFVLGRL